MKRYFLIRPDILKFKELSNVTNNNVLKKLRIFNLNRIAKSKVLIFTFINLAELLYHFSFHFLQ